MTVVARQVEVFANRHHIVGVFRLRGLQREGRLPPFPIIALTAHAFGSDALDASAAGMDGFLTKPLDREHLAGVVAMLSATRPLAA